VKATFALLADTEVHNVVRKLAWNLHQKYRTGTLHVRLPPHISLKQPFAVSDLDGLEHYMAELASSITPFDVQLTDLILEPLVFEGKEFGMLWLDVLETQHLRQLHNRLNQELTQHFGTTGADYDGERYHFHMTVLMAGQPLEVYQKLYDDFPQKTFNLTLRVRDLAMFVYDEPLGPQGEYLTYRIIPIGNF
jgi:2'-5' RNA ligase